MKYFLWLVTVNLFFSCRSQEVKSRQNKIDNDFVITTLDKGIGLDDWFTDYSDTAQFNTRFTFSSLLFIKSLGFKYVRIPVGETILFNPVNPSELNKAHLTFVDAGVLNAIKAGLAVTIDFHPLYNDIDSLLSNDSSEVYKLIAYWKSLAAFFKKYPADKLFFEVYNEPHASSDKLTRKTKEWWQPVQEQLINAIRSETKTHYIIAGGEDWNSIDGLTYLRPYNDKKIIYTFHFYEPFLFTHQGANWVSWEPAKKVKNLTYPAEDKNIAMLTTLQSDNEVREILKQYGKDKYNSHSLNAWIKKAYNWSQQYHVPVICNEFGSYKLYAPKQSRLNYIRDVRSILESYRIGWCMWEYDGDFGLINYLGENRNSPVPDKEMLNALGLASE